MKNKTHFTLLIFFAFCSVIYSQIPAYVLLPGNRHLAVGDRPLYYVHPSPVVGNQALLNIILSATGQVNPRNSIGGNSSTTPDLYYAGESFSGGALTVELGPVGSTALANNSILGGGSGATTFWKITMGYNEPWVNGASTSGFDIGTTFRHELCHGVGLAHNFAGNSQELMSAQQSMNDVDFFGSHERAGFRKIYFDINCTDCGSGAVAFTKRLDIVPSKPKAKLLVWNLEERGVSSEFVLGFNIFKKKDGKLVSLNNELIPTALDKTEYSYTIEDYQADNYFIEIVTDDHTFNEFLKIESDD